MEGDVVGDRFSAGGMPCWIGVGGTSQRGL